MSHGRESEGGSRKALEAHPETGLPSIREPVRAGRVIWRLLAQPTSLASLDLCIWNNPALFPCAVPLGILPLGALSRRGLEGAALALAFAPAALAP